MSATTASTRGPTPSPVDADTGKYSTGTGGPCSSSSSAAITSATLVRWVRTPSPPTRSILLTTTSRVGCPDAPASAPPTSSRWEAERAIARTRRAHWAGGLDHGHHRVDVVKGRCRRFVHALTECRARLVQPRCVHEDHLGVGPVEDTADLRAGGVRTRRRDGHLGADDRVHEGGLADIGPAHHRDEARPEDGHLPAPAAGSAMGTIRTRSIRRPLTRSATSRRPPTVTDSPASGTCPNRSNTRPPTVSHAPVGGLVFDLLGHV